MSELGKYNPVELAKLSEIALAAKDFEAEMARLYGKDYMSEARIRLQKALREFFK